jgi:hypothetical protein
LQLEKWDLDEKIENRHRAYAIEKLNNLKNSYKIPEKNPTLEEIIASLPFTPAPRVTEADDKNDYRSIDRKLQDSLFLVVKRNREDNSWQFPQVIFF